MWKLIKADIVYNRVPVIFLYSVIFFAVVINSAMGNQEKQLATLMFFSSFSGAFLNPTGTLGLFLLSLSLMALSVFVYEQRRSYTE